MSAKAIARKPLDLVRMRRVMAYNVRLYRKERELSQAQLASLIGNGYKQKHISSIENATLYIDFALLVGLCRVLDISMQTLLNPPVDMSLTVIEKQRPRGAKKKRKERSPGEENL